MRRRWLKRLTVVAWVSWVVLVCLSTAQARVLTFEERVEAQRAIERVEWAHRIWPAENPQSKPALEEILTEQALRRKVADSLRASAAFERTFDRRLSSAELQAELDRMALETRQPEKLAEIFSALGNDPSLIVECLVRPVLVERMLAQSTQPREGDGGKADAERQATDDDAVRAAGRVPGFRLSGPSGTNVRNAELVGGSSITDDIEPSRSLSLEDLGPQTDLPSSAGSNVATPHTGAPVDADEPAHFLETRHRDEMTRSSISGTRHHMPATESEATYVLPAITAPLTCQDDTWTPTSTTGVAPGRTGHAAVWTGSEMIIWGGVNSTPLPLVEGHRYDPATDSWTTLPPPPPGTNSGSGTSAVWTGTHVIVWGGGYIGDFNSEDWNTGARFDPAANTWAPTSTAAGVPGPRSAHTAVWTGTRMIVWGGFHFTSPGGVGTALNTGGEYDPVTDTWTPTNQGFLCNGGARSGQSCQSANNGLDCPGTCSGGAVPGESCSPADPMNCAGACSLNHSARCRTNAQCSAQGAGVCTAPGPGTCTGAGSCQNLVFAPSARTGHTAVWTGSRMVVWGGDGGLGGGSQTGARYDPDADTWTPTSTGANVPSARSRHAAVWTGSRMIVWGGADQTGGLYDPTADTWAPTTGANVPPARAGVRAVWTGNEMVVWGGSSTNTGGRYAPATDTWRATSRSAGVPTARDFHTSVWTGSEMIEWGGSGGGNPVNTGGRYCASSTCNVVTWYRDVDGDGYGRSSDTVLSCAQPPGYAVYGGDCNESNPAIHPNAPEACDAIDSDCDGNPNPLAPAGSPALAADRTGLSTTQLSWTPLAGATSYDVVRGSLATLASTHGDFTAATNLCVANDLAATTKSDTGMPAAGTGSWYLVRGSNCGGAGSYNEGAPSQVGSRDAEIQASVAACP